MSEKIESEKIEEKIEIERVEWGSVTKIFCSGKRVYLIYGPVSTETARVVRERLEAEGYSDIIMLNEGVDSDAEISKKLVLQALQHDC